MKEKDEVIFKRQKLVKLGIYVDAENKVRSVGSNEEIPVSNIVVPDNFKLYKRIFSRTFYTGYTYKFKEIEVEELVVNLKGELSILQYMEITECGQLKYMLF